MAGSWSTIIFIHFSVTISSVTRSKNLILNYRLQSKRKKENIINNESNYLRGSLSNFTTKKK